VSTIEWHPYSWEMTRKTDDKTELVNARVRDAIPSDYKAWLMGYLKRGGKITQRYDYEMPARWYVAKGDIELEPLHGANSVNIIIPQGLNAWHPLGLGHCNLYFMKEFDQIGGWVPLYVNIFDKRFQQYLDLFSYGIYRPDDDS